MGSAVAMLRARTAAAHDAVDAAFGRFRLNDPADYRAMLLAHARALPVAEATLAALPFARTLSPRTPLLAADLADLGDVMPPPLAFAPLGDAALWGTLYVVEGSRLGGTLLARSVPDTLPHRYLAATHGPGDWLRLREAIDVAAKGQDSAWHDALLAGAMDTFALYAAAAEG